MALEDVVDGAYEDTLALLYGKERSASRKEFSALMAKMEEKMKTGEIGPPTKLILGSKRVQGFSLEGLTDQGISYTDPATVHAKITTHFSDWYTAPQGPWAVPIPSPDAHWSQLEAPWEDFKEGLASKNIPEIPLRKIYDALNSDKIERGSCLAALQCPTSDDFRGAIRASKKNSTPGMSGL